MTEIMKLANTIDDLKLPDRVLEAEIHTSEKGKEELFIIPREKTLEKINEIVNPPSPAVLEKLKIIAEKIFFWEIIHPYCKERAQMKV
jgi:hypothetical protein